MEQQRAYRQIPGAAWPSGDCQPIAVIKALPADINRRLSVTFDEGDEDDGLGVADFVSIRLADGQQFLLVYHRQAPRPSGTEVYCDSAADPATVLDAFLSATGIARDELSWERPRG